MNLIIYGKKIIAATLYYSGLVNYIKRHNGEDSIILAYHRVLPHDSECLSFIQPGMYVTLETFEQHLAFISKKYQVIGLQDLISLPTPRNACIITFDDGWADNFTYAFPLLKKYAIPATIFLTTNMIGTSQWPWPDRISYYIHTIPLDDFVNTWIANLRAIGEECLDLDLNSQDKQVIRERIINHMKTIDNQKLLSFMEEIDKTVSHQKDCLNNIRPWLTWNEIIEMRNEGVSFGSHTHNHQVLTRIPLQQAREEILCSREILSEKLGGPVVTFSYPNGDYNSDLMRVVKESGYNLAVTTKRGFLDETYDLLALKRLMLHDDMTNTIPMLACVLTNKIPFF